MIEFKWGMENLFIGNLIIQLIFWLIGVLYGVLLFELPSLFNHVFRYHQDNNARIINLQGVGSTCRAHFGTRIQLFQWFAFKINAWLIWNKWLYQKIIDTCRSTTNSYSFAFQEYLSLFVVLLNLSLTVEGENSLSYLFFLPFHLLAFFVFSLSF